MIEFILGVICGAAIMFFWRNPGFLGETAALHFRPSLDWVPDANVDDDYKLEAYRRAANNLGIRIKFAQPVPCPAGTSLCAGMTGIWIHREDAEKLKGNEFTNEMWKEWGKLTR